MRLAKLLIVGLLSLLACGCTTRVELGTPVLAIYKHARANGTIWLDASTQIYYNGRVTFMQREKASGRHLETSALISRDSVLELLRAAHAISLMIRDPDIRYAPFKHSGLTLDLAQPESLLGDYSLWIYRDEDHQNTVIVYPDSPAELREFGERIMKATSGGSLR